MARRKLEKRIERDFCRYVKNHGEECLKLSTPGTLGLPDRLIPFDGGRVWFVEFKRPGEVIDPDGPQQFWKDVLEAKGFTVDVFDSLEEAKKAFHFQQSLS